MEILGEDITVEIHFEPKEEPKDFTKGELWIDTWHWNGNEITDIYAWPGDNQCGMILCNGVPAIGNGDGSLSVPSDYPQQVSEPVRQLRQKIESLEHIRDNLLYAGGECSEHKHCRETPKMRDTIRAIRRDESQA